MCYCKIKPNSQMNKILITLLFLSLSLKGISQNTHKVTFFSSMEQQDLLCDSLSNDSIAKVLKEKMVLVQFEYKLSTEQAALLVMGFTEFRNPTEEEYQLFLIRFDCKLSEANAVVIVSENYSFYHFLSEKDKTPKEQYKSPDKWPADTYFVAIKK